MTDEELIKVSKNSAISYSIIFARYYNIVSAKANKFKNCKDEFDDLMQEGFIGLFRAYETYNEAYEVKFSTYANVCITNSMTAAASKNSFGCKSDCSYSEKLTESSISKTPENIILEKEKIEELSYRIRELLSEKELRVFRLFFEGCTYAQISNKLNFPQKVVDNALQRVRRKLKSVWNANN